MGISRTYVDNNAGTVDYTNGIIKINSINIIQVEEVDGVTSSSIRFVVVPDSKDIKAVRNQLLNIDLTNSVISGKVDTISVGQPGAANSFTTTPTIPTTSQSF